jgi:hypothetical protein
LSGNVDEPGRAEVVGCAAGAEIAMGGGGDAAGSAAWAAAEYADPAAAGRSTDADALGPAARRCTRSSRVRRTEILRS